MTLYRCNTCKGVYSDKDGYFHSCPDVIDKGTGTTKKRPYRRNENWSYDAEGKQQIISKGRGRKRTNVSNDK